jgi:hypothetical protein
LPGGRTFRELWLDPTIWINFDPQTTFAIYGGKAFGYPQNITITAYALGRGRWMTAATLIHELAHANGAAGERGGAHAADAERVLRSCLLRDLFDPATIGEVSRARLERIA